MLPRFLLLLRHILVFYALSLPQHVMASGNVVADTVYLGQYLESAALAQKNGNYTAAFETLQLALEESEKRNDLKSTLRLLIQISILRHTLNDYDIALELLFRAEEISETIQDQATLAEVYNNIGAIYHTQREFIKAANYYNSSIDIYLDLGKKAEIGRAYNNFGVLWQDRNEPKSAIDYHRKSISIWRELNERNWIGVSNMHLGACHKLIGNLDSAVYYLTKSTEAIAEIKEHRILSLVYSELGDVYIKAGKQRQAVDWCRKGLELSTRMGIINYQLKNCYCLFEAYEKMGNEKEALSFYKLYATYQDSAQNEEKAKEMTRIEMGHLFERQQVADSIQRSQQQLLLELQHQEELTNERADRNIALSIGIGILLLSGGLWSRLRYARKAERTIKRERDRSDELLLNILPAEIATELKQNGTAKAKRYEQATILFTDFEQFTVTASQMPASDLVEEINWCFTNFDKVCEKYNIEKIKTIGDAYMAVGGVPVPNQDATAQVVRAAMEMQQIMLDRAEQQSKKGLNSFKMRAGIHVGPIVAGIVGIKKFQYDIWGDTVNTASRMESSGQVGKVNISEATYNLVKDLFTCEYRGEIEAKGKGKLGMYFVSLKE